MKLFGAIDLHSNNNVTVLIDERDEVVYRKRLPNDLRLITEQLSPHQSTLEGIVVESTYNWYWLVDGLMEKEHRVHLANTAAIQQYEGLKYTDDDSDARWLAHLLRLGVLPQLYLSETRTSGQGSTTQAQPVGAPEDRQSVERPESLHP
jgi:transposase